jgi:hypothetical protein
MQYILNEEEYKKLVSVDKMANMVTNEDLQKATDSFINNLELHLKSLQSRARSSFDGRVDANAMHVFIEAVREDLRYLKTAAKLQ